MELLQDFSKLYCIFQHTLFSHVYLGSKEEKILFHVQAHLFVLHNYYASYCSFHEISAFVNADVMVLVLSL